MSERHISEEEVENVLANPSIDYPSGSRQILIGDGGAGKRVKLVTDPRLGPADGGPIIITVADPDE